MPSDIVDMMYTIGPIPMEAVQFLRVVDLAANRVNEKRRHSKSSDKASNTEEKYKDTKKLR
jgi:hypothetical protein